MDSDEFALINLMIEKNEEMRIIAVGDDDQNIYSFRGSDSRYLNQFITVNNAKKYELIENFRSKNNLVEFTNQFVVSIKQRLKDKPIKAIQIENGKIKIVKYSSSHLIIPLIQDVLSTDISGSTCILTSTNEEAFHITGILIKNDIRAKLIQSNDDFSLFNLFEVRYFLDELKMEAGAYIIHDDIWYNAKSSVINRFKQSSKLEIIVNLIKDFEQTNPKKKFKSDLEVFIRESKLEDFFIENGETIFVSTIHKAKGKEFDNVFVMLDKYDVSTDDKKRQLYVAMTRAKNNLTIHYNGSYLDNLAVDDLAKTENNNNFHPTDEFALQLNHKDLNLGYFEYIQRRVDPLTSGEKIIINEEGCLNQKNDMILKFSKNFRERLLQIKQSGFHATSGVINYIVYWKNDETNNEVKIVLPELSFIRNT
jgi:ATP-dependent DNA helicase RecQ